MNSEERLRQIRDLQNASPLEITDKLIKMELYDAKSSQEIIDEVYEEFQNGGNMKKQVLMPVFLSVADGLLEALPNTAELRRKGLTASRIVQDCESFTYINVEPSVHTSDGYIEHKNISDAEFQKAIVQPSSSYNRSSYEDKAAMEDYKQKQFGDNKVAIDEYTGKRNIYKEQKNPDLRMKDPTHRQQAQPDHIVPLKEIHSRISGTINLSDEDIKKIGNLEGNLALTSARINQQKKEKSNIELIASKRENGQYLNIQTEISMAKAQANAEVKIVLKTTEIMVNKVKDNATEQATNNAIGNVLMFAIKPIYYEVKDIFSNGLTRGVRAASRAEALKIRFMRVKNYIVENVMQFIGDNLIDFIKGLISSLIEGIISLFVGILKQILKVIKEGIKVFVQSAKILFGKESASMTAAQKGDAIINILGGTVIALAGIGIEALLNKIGIGEPWSVVISTMLSGIASALFMYLLDKIDLFSVKAEQRYLRIKDIFDERITDIEQAKAEFNFQAIEALKKQRMNFENINSSIESAFNRNDMEGVNKALYSMADFFKFELPYRSTQEFVKYFDEKAVLEI